MRNFTRSRYLSNTRFSCQQFYSSVLLTKITYTSSLLLTKITYTCRTQYVNTQLVHHLLLYVRYTYCFVWIEHFSFTYTGPPIVRCILLKQPDVCSNAFLFSCEGSLECTMSHPSIFTFILGPPLWRHCFWCYRFMYVYVQMKWYINLG